MPGTANGILETIRPAVVPDSPGGRPGAGAGAAQAHSFGYADVYTVVDSAHVVRHLPSARRRTDKEKP